MNEDSIMETTFYPVKITPMQKEHTDTESYAIIYQGITRSVRPNGLYKLPSPRELGASLSSDNAYGSPMSIHCIGNIQFDCPADFIATSFRWYHCEKLTAEEQDDFIAGLEGKLK
jgi:hypothetical protein